MLDKTKLGAMMTALGEIYNREISPQLVAMYASILADYSDEEVAGAIRAHVAGPEGRFFPTPSHIMAALRGDSEAAAALALSRQGRKYGDDPIANRCILAMGGEFSCAHMESGVFNGQFRRAYVALHSSGAGPVLAKTRGFLSAGEAPPEIDALIGGEEQPLLGGKPSAQWEEA